MYPYPLHLLGVELSAWNATFLLGVLLGYPVLRTALRARAPGRSLSVLPLRWLVTVYLSAIAAQCFAYAFDASTTLLPPPGHGWARYYFDPLSGPKTLYGAVLALPLGVLVAAMPWRSVPYAAALDAWTPPMFAVLAVSRIGCFLQGCCYGIRSSFFGTSFPVGAPAYEQQLAAGIIAPGSPPLPVVPTQLIEAAALITLCGIALAQLRHGRGGLYVPLVVAYSAFRFVIELVRDDPERNALVGLSTSQWTALLVIATYAAWRQSRRLAQPA